MANKGIKFVSGPRIALKFGNHAIAYAIGTNLSISMVNAPIGCLGRVDAVAIEPLAYGLVRGSMTIVQLKDAAAASDLFPDSTALGNSAISDLSWHLNPDKVLLSETFDLDVLLATPTGQPGQPKTLVNNEYLKVQDVRLSGWSGGVSVAQALNETVSFSGLLLLDALDMGNSALNTVDSATDQA